MYLGGEKCFDTSWKGITTFQEEKKVLAVMEAVQKFL